MKENPLRIRVFESLDITLAVCFLSFIQGVQLIEIIFADHNGWHIISLQKWLISLFFKTFKAQKEGLKLVLICNHLYGEENL